MAELTSEWCRTRIESCEHEATKGLPVNREYHAKLAAALRIAARVLDEGFPQKLAELVMFNTGEITTADCMEAAQAVINYLLEGKE